MKTAEFKPKGDEGALNVVQKLRRSSRPVVFGTGVPEAPCSLCGTAFMVGYRSRIFIVTARHVVADHPVERVFILPSVDSIEPLRFSDWSFVEAFEGDEKDEEASDIMAIEVDMRRMPWSDRQQSHLIVLDSPANWYPDRFTARFFLCGYPSTENGVDYIAREISTAQYFLEGAYVRRDLYSSMSHELRVANPFGLSDFNGLSGSPVFSSVNSLMTAADDAPKFCGMALRGSATHGTVHLLEARAIMDLLAAIITRKDRLP